MAQQNYLVIGARGNVGSGVVQNLLENDFSVRQATSQSSNLGPHQVYLNLVTGEGINAAFDRIQRVFILCPPGFSNQYSLLAPLIQESKRRGLQKVVLMTALGANADETSPFRKAEIDLEKSGLNYNVIRPNWFFQNFNTFWISSILQHDKILLPAGSAKVSFIDTRDISAVAAQLLSRDGEFDQKAFDLTGAEAVDHYEVASELTKVSGRTISYQEISNEEFLTTMINAGLPKDYAQFLVLIFGFLKAGYNASTTTSVADILRVAPKSLAQYARDYRTNWIKK